jgi:hypothetical protein
VLDRYGLGFRWARSPLILRFKELMIISVYFVAIKEKCGV